MGKIFLILYVLSVVAFFTGAIFWVRKKKRELRKSPFARLKLTRIEQYLLSEMPPGYFSSVEFYVAFTLIAALAIILFKTEILN